MSVELKGLSIAISHRDDSLTLTVSNASIDLGDRIKVDVTYPKDAGSARTVTLSYSSGETRLGMADLHFELVRVAKRSIISLLDERDFLAYQLTHANGGLTDEQLDELAEAYLPCGDVDVEDVARGAVLLAALVPDRFSADLVSVVFKCELEQAERAISIAKSRLELGRTSKALL